MLLKQFKHSILNFKGTKRANQKIHAFNISFSFFFEEFIFLTCMMSELISVPHIVKIRSYSSEGYREFLLYEGRILSK